MGDKSYFPCPVCRKMLVVSYTKKYKPYCTCNDCGVQLFVRGKKGIYIFKKLLGDPQLRSESKDLINDIDYFNRLKEKLEEIQEEKPIFGTDSDLEIQEKLVLHQLSKLRKNMRNANSS